MTDLNELFASIAANVTTAPVKAKESKNKNPYRVNVDNIFIQPCGGKVAKNYADDATKYKWNYVYIGVRVDEKVTRGLTLPTRAVLELGQLGILGRDVLEAFNTYCEAQGGKVQM